MTDWGYKPEWSVSFDIPVDEKMNEFIDKMNKEHKEVEDVFAARIKKLFEEYIELDGAAILGYDKFLALFRLGYSLGWNDHFNTLETKEVDFEKEVNACLFSLDIDREERPETAEVIEIVAKHFFELGLKAKKGE